MKKVEQISIPLACVFNLSLNEGVVPFDWKKQILCLYLNRVPEINKNIILTSVILKYYNKG